MSETTVSVRDGSLGVSNIGPGDFATYRTAQNPSKLMLAYFVILGDGFYLNGIIIANLDM